MIRSDEWTKYYDEQHSSYYLYNEKTGESVWEDEFVDAVRSASTAETGLHSRAVEHDSSNTGMKGTKTFRAKDYPRDIPLTPAEQTQYDLVCYGRFIFLNAILVEAPLTILESLIRLLAVSMIAVIKLLAFGCQRKWRKCWRTVQQGVREMLLVTAAALSLAVPGLICWIYWNHSYENEWEIRPLPTLLGYVDMRRFAVISYGGGALASNIAGDAVSATETESAVERLKAIGSKKKVRIKDDNQDSWKGRLLWVPREIIADCSSFLGGNSDRLDSLDVAL